MAGVPPNKGASVSSPDPNAFYPLSGGGHLHNSYGRETSASRGRGPGLPATPSLSINSQRELAARTLSPRTQGPTSNEPPSRPGTASGNYIERRRSGNYGHFRQHSAAQGLSKHSRENSVASNSATYGNRGPVGGLTGATPEYETTIYGANDSPVDFRSQSAAAGQFSADIGPSSGHAISPQRLDQKSTAKPRKGHGRSASSKGSNDLRSVGEYALHHLFNSFVGKADFKINQCVTSIPDAVEKVEHICGPGVDKDFDSLISALGHIARQKPKHLVDTIMYWRKAKSEESQAATAHYNTVRASDPYFRTMQRRNTEASVNGSADLMSPVSADDPAAAALKQAETHVHQSDRRLSLSIYLICRVLIEVYQQSDLDCITPTLDDRLEDLIFDQLSRLDPARVEASPFHFANWTMYGQLLGVMSTQNFAKVSSRFTAVLRHGHAELGPKGAVAHEQEARLELMIRAMQYVCVDAFPEGRWIETCDFMCNIAQFFSDSHGLNIKHAYCDVLETLVFPVAATPGPQLVSPRWKEFLSLLNSRLGTMLVKPKHWSDAFSLSTLLLCASPGDIFTTQWMSSITSLQPKLKDRNTRPIALQAICRIVWAYLKRFGEQSNTMRKLEDVVKIVLPSGKKTLLSTDPAILEPIVEFIRTIGYYHPEFAFKNIIFPLMNAELFSTHKEIKTDQLEPERTVIGIRAFLAIIGDLEKPPGERKAPQLPQFDKGGRVPEDPPTQRSKNYLAQFERRKTIPTTEDALSKVVNVAQLDDRIRDYFGRFCEILGKVTIVCDNTFGGQATLDEKFGGLTPKTPISDSFSFTRREDNPAIDHKQGFYELLYVATQALPRCLSKDIPFNSLINLLCTGTAHMQQNIATSSARSLKAIARQNHAQQVTVGFARFIFNFDVRYSTMSDEGLLGPGHIESTLQLYLELLKIWIEEIKKKSKHANSVQSPDPTQSNRSLQLDLATVSAHVDELEAHGVFFLCSQSRRVRGFAVGVLRLVTEFDEALGQRSNSRVIAILESDLSDVISPEDESLNAAEKARLQKSRRKTGDKTTLIDLCSSDVSYDSSLWTKIFPNLMRMISEQCVNPVYLGRDIVCARLVQMLPAIRALSEGQRPGQVTSPYERPTAGGRLGSTGPEIIIEQWRIYLVMACTTLRDAGGQSQAQLASAQHARNKSKVIRQGSKEISSARSLFATVIPLLNSVPPSLREAVVTALGSINTNMYRTLLESLQYAVTTCVEEAKMRSSGQHQRSGSNPRPRDRKTEILRTEVTHVYKFTAKFLHEPDVLKDDWILGNLIRYTDEIRGFLSGEDIQSTWEVNTLKKHFCGLLEEVFEGINRSGDPSRWMTFEARRAAFTLIEEWCGFSPNQSHINLREESLKQFAMSQHYDGDRSNVASQFEVAKRDLRLAALSAMASLCAGPIGVSGGSRGMNQSFNVPRILNWAEQIFNTQTDKMHLTGRRALKNLVIYNPAYPSLLEHVMDMCLSASTAKALESYFEVVATVLSEQPEYPVPFWRIVIFVLFALGNEKSAIRIKAVKALRAMEIREQKTSKLQDFEISIADKTTAVYKAAQYQISLRLAKQHTDIAFFVFSQWSRHYKNVHPNHQRNMIHGILPWLQSIELGLSTNGGPTPQTHMLLANLLEITTRASNALHNEMQGIWSALANGNAGNVQLTLDFIITLCLEKREQSFVEYAKQIVVFLSSTQAGQKVVEFLLQQITPKNMVYVEKKPTEIPQDTLGLPYTADLGEVLPIGNRPTGLALGQLSLILLVDLMIAPVKLNKEQLPLLLQVCTVLWDHYTPLVQEEAREMLVHLVHELVISQIDDDNTTPTKESIENFVEAVRQSKPEVVWTYQDSNSKDEEDEGMRVPQPMSYVTNEVINLFTLAYPDIHEQWAKITLSWATSCSVRHLACRSFQIFRCVLSSLDQPMLADMLARLSNTIADDAPEVQGFSMEILTTLRTIIGALEPADLLKYPQLFWVTCACLNTVNEREFIETLTMLDVLLVRVNLSDPAVVKILLESRPEKWEGEFNGILPLICRGLNSADSHEKALVVISKTISLPDSELLGDEGRLLFNVMAFLPFLLQSFGPGGRDSKTMEAVESLAVAAESENKPELGKVLNAFVKSRYSGRQEFLAQIVSAVRQYFFPAWEFKGLVFMMGLLSNRLPWFKFNVMDMLCVFIPVIDMRGSEAASHGPDLISPLLRLLQTEYCPQALKVMDLIMTMNSTPMDRHHLRMSMIMSGSTKSIRKEFERTQSLYGIPEESGWSIPVPALHSNNTRANVHAVFFTCAGQSTESAPVATPEIEFDEEEDQNSYFPTDRADTMMSEETRVESGVDSMNFTSSAGDLASKLKSLDDFFDEDDEGNDDKYLSRYSDITITGFSPDPDSGANLYDQQTAPILNKSLARNASVTSLQNPYSDIRATGVMNPGAFSNHTANQSLPVAPLQQRPGLHTRSITSPSAQNFASSAEQDSLSESENEQDGVFSDDERSTGYNSPTAYETAMRRSRSATGKKYGPGTAALESRQGDLLRGQSRLRSKSQAPGSPEVPKVPEAYLNMPKQDS